VPEIPFRRTLKTLTYFFTYLSEDACVGEQTGNLEQVLRSLSGYMEKQSAALGKLKQALTYPAIVSVVAVAVMVLMVTVVLPPILNMFTSLKGEIPITTKLLLAIVDIFKNYSLHMVVGFLIILFVAYTYSKTPTAIIIAI